MKPGDTWRCSFCSIIHIVSDKPPVAGLMGAGVAICNKCVYLATKLIRRPDTSKVLVMYQTETKGAS